MDVINEIVFVERQQREGRKTKDKGGPTGDVTIQLVVSIYSDDQWRKQWCANGGTFRIELLVTLTSGFFVRNPFISQCSAQGEQS